MPILSAHSVPPVDMDVVGEFGFCSMFLALVFLLHFRRSRSAMLGLSACLLATSAYGFLAGAWPLGILQLAWACAVLHRWHRRPMPGLVRSQSADRLLWLPRSLISTSRMKQMFGPL